MTTLRRVLKSLPLFALRQWRRQVFLSAAARLFQEPRIFFAALKRKGADLVVLRMRDGLHLTIRQNLWDARIVQEIFLDECYTRGLPLPPHPIIVDIGGYIGDFSLFAAKRLKASRVIVYEPTIENFALLTQNIADNDYGGRITAVNKAVSDADEVTLNVEIGEGEEVHASSYLYPKAEQRKVAGITLADLMHTHALDRVDLLKVDCEGGEYRILGTAPEDLFYRIENIVFEYHRIDGYEEKLRRTLTRLRSTGYHIYQEGILVWATRAPFWRERQP